MPFTKKDFDYILGEIKDELEFNCEGEHFFVSASIAANGKIFIGGPGNAEYVDTVDEVLDKLIVRGKPLRDMLDKIS